MRKLVIYLISFTIVLLLVGFYLHRVRNGEKTTLTLYGNVDVRELNVGFRVGGKVSSMPFQEGDLITPGTVVAKLDGEPYLDEARVIYSEIEAKKAQISNQQLIADRRKALVIDGAVGREDFETAESELQVLKAELKSLKARLGVAVTNLKDTHAVVPSKGTVLTRIREPGSIVRVADPVYTISLVDPIWIRAYVSEPQLGLIYPGMKAKIYTDSPGKAVYEGHIGFISPVAEFTPKTVQTTELRTALVFRLRIIAKNPDYGLKQGMPVTVELDLTQDE